MRKTVKRNCKQCSIVYGARLDRANHFCSTRCFGMWQSSNVIGIKNPFYGRKHSEETKEILRKRTPQKYWLGKSRSKETKEKIRLALQGESSSLWKGGISAIPGYAAFHSRRRQIRKLNAEGSHTQKEWLILKSKYNFICPSCFLKEPFIKLTEDHIVPLIDGGTDYIENIQPLCQSCNSKKARKVIKYEHRFAIITS